MIRAILSVVIGLVLYFVLRFISTLLLVAVALLSVGGAANNPEGTTRFWLIVGLVFFLIAAMVAGCVCAAIARRSRTPPRILAGLILAIGIGILVYGLFFRADPGTNQSAATQPSTQTTNSADNVRVPMLLDPIIGCAGVLMGAALVRRGTPTAITT